MSLSLIVKCTRRCNLRCSYCHDWRDRGVSSLSFEHLVTLTEEAFDQADRVQFIWHGGEPLLLGKEWFEKALFVQDLVMEQDQAAVNQLQTNATLLDEEWVDFFEEHNFQLGVSVDGPPEMHDETRVDVQGRGTSDRVREGIELLKDSEVPFGLLMVVTEDVLQRDPVAIYEWFKSIDAPSVGFLSQRPDTEGLEEVREPSEMSAFLAKERYSEFMCGIFEEWWADDGAGPEVRELSALLKGLVDSSPGLCIYEGSCVGKYFGVNPNGDVYHCDRYIPDPEYKVGNIGDEDFTFLPDHILEIQQREAEKEAAAEESCEWYNVCHGGCPHDRNTNPLGWESRDSCCGMSTLLTRMDEKVEQALPE
ncbi:radical SAM/SPASM domain-containing protein [Halobellus limi]|uniref:Radical SAM protein n=1 Tax=Halobellus limi TaxID=699433 RepID=A0A1H6CKQ4_9EURY|nr:radical SAM protein [Halobellus limi]QCC48772.1 radical SAM protein [Halobellus limi]SEG73550.1 uncharacterized protein SAMN04488133_3510 [Halobellus limi]